ncbi:MAG: Fis family transcriptional regulator [Marinomonas sp.]
MKKSDKKLEKGLREALTRICDEALESVPGFVWITHLVNFNRFPDSLKVVCVFETDDGLSNACKAKHDERLRHVIANELKTVGVTLKNQNRQVVFDTEEACQRSHDGKWGERLTPIQTLH